MRKYVVILLTCLFYMCPSAYAVDCSESKTVRSPKNQTGDAAPFIHVGSESTGKELAKKRCLQDLAENTASNTPKAICDSSSCEEGECCTAIENIVIGNIPSGNVTMNESCSPVAGANPPSYQCSASCSKVSATSVLTGCGNCEEKPSEEEEEIEKVEEADEAEAALLFLEGYLSR